jgi:hypothetical protein
MSVLGKFALILGFGSILFTLFIVFNTPGALEQAARLDFPLAGSLNDAAQITLMLPVFLAIGATLVAFTQLRDDHGGRVFVLVAISWLVLISVIGLDGVQSFFSR